MPRDHKLFSRKFTSVNNPWHNTVSTNYYNTSMNKRTAQLRHLMAQNNLSCKDVAAITGRTENTVRIWRCKHGARVIPEPMLRLLNAEVRLAAAKGVAA